MRLFLSLLVAIIMGSTPAIAGSTYLGLSFGTSYEDHKFDVWNGPATAGRRALSAHARSSDYAVAIGIRDAFRLGNRAFDLELEIFERSNSDFIATGAAGNHPTAIRTTSMLASVWTGMAAGDNWSLKVGAGIGARHSSYLMSGPGVSFRATDRAPYAMIGLRLSKSVSKRTTVYTELRAHTRPPIKSAGTGAFRSDPLEHNSKGLTLRLGLQIKLGK